MLPAVTRGTYEFAVSGTCVIFFLIQSAIAIAVFMDASRRGLPALTWAFIAFVPYVGLPIYLIYIVATGQTRFHIRKNPASEEIKKKWEDTPSSLDRDKESLDSTSSDLSPYRKR